MRTPSLQQRVTVAVVALLAVVLAVAQIAGLAWFRGHLDADLEELLAERTRVATILVDEHAAQDLPAALTATGIPAILRHPDGSETTAGPVAADDQRAPRDLVDPDNAVRRIVPFAGGEVEVLVDRSRVDGDFAFLQRAAAVVSAAALLAAALLAGAVSRHALVPLARLVQVAERTAAGDRGRRVGPDRPTTDLGRAAAAHDHMVDRLEEAIATAEAQAEAQRRFIADAAHQLRTPLASVRLALDALPRVEDPTVRAELLERGGREAQRSARIVRDLLTLARHDGTVAIELAPLRLDRLAAEEVGRMAGEHRDLDWQLDAPPLLALASDGELREALANLLDNAARHARRWVRVTVASASGWVRLQVRDDGPGVPAVHRERVFERFASLDGHNGSGLGLSVVRSVAQRHGGTARWGDDGVELVLPAAAGAVTSGPAVGTAPSGPTSAARLARTRVAMRPATRLTPDGGHEPDVPVSPLRA